MHLLVFMVFGSLIILQITVCLQASVMLAVVGLISCDFEGDTRRRQSLMV